VSVEDIPVEYTCVHTGHPQADRTKNHRHRGRAGGEGVILISLSRNDSHGIQMNLQTIDLPVVRVGEHVNLNSSVERAIAR